MAFAGCSQAEDEAQRTFGQVGLVRVWNDRGFEQGSRFQRIFVSKMRPEQKSSFLGQFSAPRQKLLRMFETALEELARLAVSFAEFGFHLLQQRAHFVFGECHDPRADFLYASLTRRIEKTNQNAG